MTAFQPAGSLTRLTLGVLLLLAIYFVPEVRAADFTVLASVGSSAYTINGVGGNPTLTLERGKTYTFQINTTTSHPFRINSAGASPNGISLGTITYTVPMAVSNYTYRCTQHSFGGNINTIAPTNVVDAPKIHVLSLTVGSNLVIRSTGTNNWSVFPEFKTNLAGTNWFALTVQSNNFLNGTNETYCGRPPGTNVFIRVRNQSN